MRNRSSLAVLAMALAAVGCERVSDDERESPPSALEAQSVTEKGSAAADVLMQRLGGQLKATLQAGGPVRAIEVCQQAARPITTAAGHSFEGVIVRRTTLKPRNSANAPDETDRTVLEKLSEMSPPEETIVWEEEVARYYRPLMIQEICLKCHGDPASFPADLTAKLAELYPGDQATGYALGDLRGVIRVDVER